MIRLLLSITILLSQSILAQTAKHAEEKTHYDQGEILYLKKYTEKNNSTIPGYRLNWISDRKEAITYSGANKDLKKTSKSFVLKKNLLTGQGQHAYIYKNLDTLVRIKYDIKTISLIPTNKDYYSFKIQKFKHIKLPKPKVFIFQVNNRFLGLSASHLEVTSDSETIGLLKFKGQLSLSGENPNQQNVTTVYALFKTQSVTEIKESQLGRST